MVICLTCFYKNTSAQTYFEYHDIYQEKTPEIMVTYDTAFYFKTVNLFSFVDYRLFTNRQVIDEILSGNSFSNKKANDTSFYIRYPINAAQIKNYCEFETAKILDHYMGMGFKKPILSSVDSIALINELTLIKKQVKDSLVKEINMSDNIFSILNKYPADLEIVTDVLMYHSNHSTSKKLNNCALLRVFIFDLRKQKIVIYNYKTGYGGINYKLYDLNQNLNPAQRFKKLIHSLKPYMKANKRYLKKIKQYDYNQFKAE
jgi:hypothetical protein